MCIDSIHELHEQREIIIRANAREEALTSVPIALLFDSIFYPSSRVHLFLFLVRIKHPRQERASSKAIDPDPPFLRSANLQASYRVNNIFRGFCM